MDKIKQFKDQDYASLKSQHDSSNLFVDPEFPAELKSIWHSGKALIEDVTWKRPTVSRKIANLASFATMD